MGDTAQTTTVAITLWSAWDARRKLTVPIRPSRSTPPHTIPLPPSEGSIPHSLHCDSKIRKPSREVKDRWGSHLPFLPLKCFVQIRDSLTGTVLTWHSAGPGCDGQRDAVTGQTTGGTRLATAPRGFSLLQNKAARTDERGKTGILPFFSVSLLVLVLAGCILLWCFCFKTKPVLSLRN